MIVYTMILVLCICMLFIELFVGIVQENYNIQKEIISENQSLTRMQMAWIKIQDMLVRSNPVKVLEPSDDKSYIRNLCIKFTETKSFDMFIMICILANTFVLGFNWYM